MMKNQKIPEVYLYVDIAKWDYPFQFNKNIFTSNQQWRCKVKVFRRVSDL